MEICVHLAFNGMRCSWIRVWTQMIGRVLLPSREKVACESKPDEGLDVFHAPLTRSAPPTTLSHKRREFAHLHFRNETMGTNLKGSGLSAQNFQRSV